MVLHKCCLCLITNYPSAQPTPSYLNWTAKKGQKVYLGPALSKSRSSIFEKHQQRTFIATVGYLTKRLLLCENNELLWGTKTRDDEVHLCRLPATTPVCLSVFTAWNLHTFQNSICKWWHSHHMEPAVSRPPHRGGRSKELWLQAGQRQRRHSNL